MMLPKARHEDRVGEKVTLQGIEIFQTKIGVLFVQVVIQYQGNVRVNVAIFFCSFSCISSFMSVILTVLMFLLRCKFHVMLMVMFSFMLMIFSRLMFMYGYLYMVMVVVMFDKGNSQFNISIHSFIDDPGSPDRIVSCLPWQYPVAVHFSALSVFVQSPESKTELEAGRVGIQPSVCQ